jgi:predicted metal-dependent phosphoesterase TrpH
MTIGAPFTYLCQTARPTLQTGRADLHLHTTASDGLYSPRQIVDLACRVGLIAIAITDHDTMGGIAAAHEAAAGRIEIISGVEISCTWLGREIHLLGYFISGDDEHLNTALERLRQSRMQRYRAMMEKLRSMGLEISEPPAQCADAALGRRLLATQLAETGAVQSVRDAFNRYLDDDKPAFVQKELLPLDAAISLVRGAGGVCSYAHPGNELDRCRLAELADVGLGAVEVEYPALKNSRKQQLRQWASELNLAITGGSDCHGPDISKRSVGISTISSDELSFLRNRPTHFRLQSGNN